MESKVLALILGGGRGERLYPLTEKRAKPAVPFGGMYRLVDIPISNCINSGFKQIYVLTQYASASLHNHIANTYTFDTFSRGFVQILAAEQTFEGSSWYLGTGDAVRKNLLHLHPHQPTHYLVLSGDQLYRMDLQDFFQSHLASGAEISIAATLVAKNRTGHLGIIGVDEQGRALRFLEKPKPDQDISALKTPPVVLDKLKENRQKGEYLASMGIYLFSAEILDKALDNELADFGKEIIPACLERFKVQVYPFGGFWEDIGTIKSFYDTNINLTTITPDFDFYNELRPIYTRRRDLPPSKINFSTITQTLAADGCIITNANLMNSIVGVRTIIESGASLDAVVCMGADFYESWEQKQQNAAAGIPDVGIGRGTMIRRAIIDKNARIGSGCRLGTDNRDRPNGDFPNYHIRDGIIIIPKNGAILSGSVI